MDTEDLTTQGANTPGTMVLTEFSRYPSGSAEEE